MTWQNIPAATVCTDQLGAQGDHSGLFETRQGVYVTFSAEQQNLNCSDNTRYTAEARCSTSVLYVLQRLSTEHLSILLNGSPV